jgi:phosphate:Na+ symporter
MVSLMVLAFVGAGVISMKNAMAVILGANVGTTLDSWLVATLGFKVNIDVVAYPVICIGGFLLAFFHHKKIIKHSAYFLLGFGLLFIGLSFMKTAMESQMHSFDLSGYAGRSLLVFLLIGFTITLIVQSSSVTMALTLSALNAGAIDFPQAATIVLGSETGTTIKIFLSALGGNPSKKRLALGNFIFNACMTIFAFVFLRSLLFLISDIFSIHDPLIGLVTFSTLINLISILIFLPLLPPFTKFLDRFFRNNNASVTAFITDANIAEPGTALDLFGKETEYFILNSMLFNLEQFKIKADLLKGHPSFELINERKRIVLKNQEEKYAFLKELQGELQMFYLKLRSELKNEESSELSQLISSVRSSMHAVKSLKDIGNNINNLRHSSKDIKFLFFNNYQKETEYLYRELSALMRSEKKIGIKEFQVLYDRIHTNFNSSLHNFYKEVQFTDVEGSDITTVINFNRELFTSNKAILMAVKDFVLSEKQALEFNEVPAYTT